MAKILLHGGLFRIFNAEVQNVAKYMPVNILLRKSNIWLNGDLIIDKTPYYRLLANRDNRIEIKRIDDYNLLSVNNNIIYEKRQQFIYDVDVKLNPLIKNSPYADFFKYY